ncbi:Calx-beta domain-containing protein [Vibrio campbellii]
MDRVAFSSLMSNIVVIGNNGEIKTLEPGQLPAPGELVITEISDTSELVFEQITPQGSSINVTDDITALIEAIAAGEDPAQVEGDFETAAGESSGSSPQTTGAVDRIGAESLASTDFETVGTSIALSETQELSLLDFLREQTMPAQTIVQEISSPTISEGQQATFDVTLDQPLLEDTNVVLTLNEGTAEGGTDYDDNIVTIVFEDGTSEDVSVDENGAFTVTIPAGERSFSVSVNTTDDDLFEGNEIFTLNGGIEGQSEPATGVATIIDDGSGPGPTPDDDRPTVVSITDTTVNEGDAATLDVTLSNPSSIDTTVIMNLADGTAEGGIDYTNTSVTITFEDNSSQVIAVNPDGSFEVSVPANDTSYSVTINTTDDDIFEGEETFELSGSTPNQNGTQSGTVTIVDDGTGPGSDPDDDRPTVLISDVGTINEGDTANFVVSLTNASEDDVQVELGLNLGDTEAGDLGTLEYNTGSGWVAVPVDGVVTVPAGLTEFDVRIASIADEVFEGPENFTVDVTGFGSVQGADTGTATIVDDGTGPGPDPDDDRPTVSISDAGTINEGDTANFIVSLTNASEDDVQVELGLNLGDTESGDLGTLEYNTGSGWLAVPNDGVVTVPAELTEFDVRIASIDDEVFEGPENFTVDVTGLGPVQGSDTGTATIVDDNTGPGPDPDDDRPTVTSITSTTVNEGEVATLDVTLSNVSTTPTVVNMTLADESAEGGVDYNNTLVTITYEDNTTEVINAEPDGSFVVTVPANDSAYSVTMITTDDELTENTETFTLSGATDVQGVPAIGTTTIIDNDAQLVASISNELINEGEAGTFDVTLSNASDTDSIVSMTLADGTADGGVDYTDTQMTITYADNSTEVVAVNPDGSFDVTVPANDTTYSITVSTTDDDLFEGPETFTLSGATAVQTTPAEGTGTIVDDGSGPGPDPDDDRPTVASISSTTVNEGDPVTLYVTMSNASTTDIVVSMTLTDGTADGGVDYTNTQVTITYADSSTEVVTVNPDGSFDVTVPANDTTYSITVSTTDDELFEGPETFTLSGATAVQTTPAKGTGTIVDDGSGPGPDPDDDRPTVASISSTTVNEGDSATLDVTMSNASTTDIVVSMTLADGTADGGVDYTDTQVTITYADSSTEVVAVNPDGSFDVTVPANDTTYSITVSTTDDDLFEGPETFTLSGATAVQTTPAEGTGTIVDDGSGPGPDPDDDRPTVASISSTTVNEGDSATLDVTMSNASTTDIVVSMTLADGTADGGVDYTDTQVTITYADSSTEVVAVNPDGSFDVTVPANDTTYSITVSTTDDDLFEGPETFTLSGATAVQTTPAEGTGTIVDDDRPTVASISSTTVNEGDPATLDVTVSNASTTDIVVSMTLADGTADGGVDYTNTQVTITYADSSTEVVAVNPDGSFDVTVPANDTTYSITVSTTDDDLFEGPETFTLSGATAVQTTSAEGTGTIVDDGSGPGPDPDDDRPTVASIGSTTVNEGDPATLDVTMSNASTTDTVVNMTLADGTADGGVDYTDTQVTITYADNSTEVVAVNPDSSFDVTVPAMDTTFSVTMETLNDDIYEGDETFTLSGSTSVQTTPAVGTVTIDDEADRPSVADITDIQVTEGEDATFNVTLSNASTVAILVSMSLLDGTALAGDDFNATSVTITYADNTTEVVNVAPDGTFDVSVPANDTTFSVTVNTLEDQVYEQSENFTLTGEIQGQNVAASGIGTILDDDNTPPTVEDFNIIIDLNNPGEDALIDFGPYAQDLEDDLDPFDDKETSICITTLPEYGYLYYFDDQNNEVVLEIGDVIPESTEVRYGLTEDFFDEQSFDSQDLLNEFDKDFIADSVDVNGLSFFGGTIDNNGDFVNNAQIKVDFANQQIGLVVVSPGETGQGDEISTSEFIAIELDEGLEAEEARLNLASLNDQFNNGAAWINVYFYMDGVLAETQVIQTSDIVFTGNQEGFATVAITNGSFDEIRLFPETNSSSDKASFTLVGTQITSFNNVNDSFDYKAIDSDGLTSADTATVDIDFTNVSVDTVEAFGIQVGALQFNTVEGTDQNDTLVGTDSNDILIGGLGDDVLTGGAGDDIFKWLEMDTATDTVTDFESGDSLDFVDLFDDVSESDISILLDDLSSGDYAGQVDDITVSVTEDGGNSTLTINKDGQQLEVNFDGASAADIANSIITNLEQLRE